MPRSCSFIFTALTPRRCEAFLCYCRIIYRIERVQVQQSGAGGGGDGVHLDVNTEVNAVKCMHAKQSKV